MSRYIDADKVILSLLDYCRGKKTIGRCVDDTPTEEVKPIIYGEWIKGKNKFGEETLTCSNCGDVWTDDDEVNINVEHFNFCPICGSTMKNESEEEE